MVRKVRSRFRFLQNRYIDTLTFYATSTLSHSSKLKDLKAADFGHFGATWFPYANYERLRIATFLAAWVSVVLRRID